MTIVVNLLCFVIIGLCLASMISNAFKIKEIRRKLREFQAGAAYRERCFKKVESLHRELEAAMKRGDDETYMKCVRRALRILGAINESIHTESIPEGKDPDDM